MATTAIEWSDRVWNPTTGCTQISPGCAHCYAKTFAARLKAMGQPKYQNDGGKGSGPGFKLTLHPDVLTEPLRWKKPSRVFLDSMSDLFHEDVPDDFIDRVFAVMALTPQHTYQVLTKRPKRMREYIDDFKADRWRSIQNAADAIGDAPYVELPLPNVWLGVTVENQRWADERIPILLDTPAAVRFLSAEPLLEGLALWEWLGSCDHESHSGTSELHVWRCDNCGQIRREVEDENGTTWVTDITESPRREYKVRYELVQRGRLPYLDWVIVGGESGPRHRRFDPAWARSIVAQCRDAGVSAFVKQLGGAHPGNKLEDLPEDLRVRDFPEVRVG